jgi:hypothetical protein
MNDTRYPFHAVSFFDCHGSPPAMSQLPREEEDFATQAEAEAWLRQRGGGTIERYDDGKWSLVATVPPKEEEEIALTA